MTFQVGDRVSVTFRDLDGHRRTRYGRVLEIMDEGPVVKNCTHHVAWEDDPVGPEGVMSLPGLEKTGWSDPRVLKHA